MKESGKLLIWHGGRDVSRPYETLIIVGMQATMPSAENKISNFFSDRAVRFWDNKIKIIYSLVSCLRLRDRAIISFMNSLGFKVCNF